MQDADQLRKVASDCVHCGFCLPACPTYQLWAEEMDSPRGRIYLVNQILDGAELTPAAAEHFDRCLGCMACMTACPSGVQYDQLIEAARVWTEEARPARPDVPAGKQNMRDRAVRAAIFALFPYPWRLRAATLPLRAAQRTGLDQRLARSSLPGRISPALGAALRLAPPTPAAGRLRTSGAGRLAPPTPAAGRLPGSGAGRLRAPGARRLRASGAGRMPERVPARAPRRAVVGMLTGCVQSVFFPRVNAATARVLAMEGCDVIIPRGQGCCGALSLHSGREAEAAAFARRTIETFEQAGVDAVVVNSAGCGSAMKEYGRLLAGVDERNDSGWPARAAALGGRVRDFAEFLAELGPAAPRNPLPVTAAYHDACHLGHAQRITRQPRELLRSIPDLCLVELADAGTCCGSAGVYNLLQPEAAGELGARKAQAVLDAGAPLLISANPGCSLQIAAALADRGEHVAVAHVAEILDASLRGLPPPLATAVAE
jgi:Fe-S oxidoreductase